MNISQDVNLKPYHTFGISVQAKYLVELGSVQDVISAYQNPDWQTLPKLVLGKGSNMLFTQDFEGVVLLNRLKGIKADTAEDEVLLEVSAGEDWPSLVAWSIEQGYAGLENLALIPGCAGSAPIQNIGAYGVELKDLCAYVDYLDLTDMQVKRLTNQECEFGYRDSIFKHALHEKAIILGIGLRLQKLENWQPKLAYGPLKAEQATLTSPRAVFEKVCEIRQSKLPDPKQIGNAGSFFKNPVITQQEFDRLQGLYPDLGGYPSEGGVKIAAGWLIDRCGLKGYQIGGAQVHPKQALVLVNAGDASAQDVLNLAQYVKQSVFDKYQVKLEHEVRFMAALNETRLEYLLGEVDDATC